MRVESIKKQNIIDYSELWYSIFFTFTVALVVRGSAGAAKCPFQKIDFGEKLIHINIQMEASCFSSAVRIIEQFLLLSRSQYVRSKEMLAQYAKRRFLICFNSIL